MDGSENILEAGNSSGAGEVHPAPNGSLWVERISLTNFRNYDNAALTADHSPVVLLGLSLPYVL